MTHDCELQSAKSVVELMIQFTGAHKIGGSVQDNPRDWQMITAIVTVDETRFSAEIALLILSNHINYPPVIKHGLLENGPVISDFPS